MICCRSRLVLQNKKHRQSGLFYLGGGTETRTLDPMIKSHLLYQLSYASKTELLSRSGAILPHKKTKIKKILQKCEFGYFLLGV